MDRSKYFRSRPKYFTDLVDAVYAIKDWSDFEALEARVIRDASVVAQMSTSQACDNIHRSIYAHAVTHAPVHPMNAAIRGGPMDRAVAELHALVMELAEYDPGTNAGWYYAASVPFANAPENDATYAAVAAGNTFREAVAAGAPFQDPIDKP